MPMNCINCGAILHGNKCEYCGTEYSGNDITAEFNENDYTGTIRIGDEIFQCYIGDMEISTIATGCSRRGIDGKLKPGKMINKRKLTVIEI